ncbi:hypothetical protein Hypma_002971 [Hypsizygus marmoreus]|uniref:Uncharacterized protein n=1 Tax=Hypsizygus marmoreus TaxID=39966 RepID=A0A369J3C4_HYPMA|nr:hypothetical protein Hypma_002971 [Hypsizygus marmoreus]
MPNPPDDTCADIKTPRRVPRDVSARSTALYDTAPQLRHLVNDTSAQLRHLAELPETGRPVPPTFVTLRQRASLELVLLDVPHIHHPSLAASTAARTMKDALLPSNKDVRYSRRNSGVDWVIKKCVEGCREAREAEYPSGNPSVHAPPSPHHQMATPALLFTQELTPPPAPARTKERGDAVVSLVTATIPENATTPRHPFLHQLHLPHPLIRCKRRCRLHATSRRLPFPQAPLISNPLGSCT